MPFANIRKGIAATNKNAAGASSRRFCFNAMDGFGARSD
jgi:hypothetical protein